MYFSKVMPKSVISTIHFKLFILILGTSLKCLGQANPNFELPAGSQTEIILLKHHNKDQEHAAKLLEKYLFLTTNITCTTKTKQNKLPCFIIQSDTSLHPDGYQISVSSEKVIIQGGKRKGCTYAVIHLLEKYLGCLYLSPEFQQIPTLTAVTLPVGIIRETPKNDVRIINIYYPEQEEYRDWLRLNAIEEIYPEGYFVHTFHRLIPWENYFENHPEYFALVNGKRSIDQLCPSNPEVLNLITERLRNEMQQQPDKQKWSVSQNDNFSFCTCEQCSATITEEGSPSGPIIRLVNEVARQFPDKLISTLAYQYSRKAPKKTKPEKNVEIMLCTIELLRHEAIETCPESASFKTDLENWGAISSHIFLWDYTINFNHSVCPFPNLHVLQPNIQFFTRNHVNALFEQSNSSYGYEFSELKAWLLAKLMWNPSIHIADEQKRFLEAYYGDAAPYINQYIRQLEDFVVSNQTKLWIYEHPVVHENDLFSVSNLARYDSCFNRAEQVVQKNPIFLNHVQTARLSLQYAQMELASNRLFSENGWYTLNSGNPVPNPSVFESLKQFEEVSRRNQVPSVNEAGLNPEDYIAALRRLIDVNIQGNYAFQKQVTAQPAPSAQYGQGDCSLLTNGVKGAGDYQIHWLGWFGEDTEIILDLENEVHADSIQISSLWNAKSWILHPESVSCSLSADSVTFKEIGTWKNGETQQHAPLTKNYLFLPPKEAFRFVKFTIRGTHTLPAWHPSAGQSSWFFLDEISVW